MQYWSSEGTKSKCRAAFSDELKEILPSDIFWEGSLASFPLYRMAGVHMDYKKLLKHGINGLKEEVSSSNVSDETLREAMIDSLDLIKVVLEYYISQAIGLMEERGYDSKNLKLIIDSCVHLQNHKPETFHQAIQLAWIYTLVAGSTNLGRFDEYLAPFYKNDIENGKITDEDALQMLVSFWGQVEANMPRYNGRIIVGGKGRELEEDSDQVAILALEATRIHRGMLPQLTLRFHNEQNPYLLEKAYRVLSEGNTFPMLYNDEVNIPAVQKAFELSESEAIQYLPYGCGEYVIYHKSFGTPNGITNLLKILEITLNNGLCGRTGKKLGLQTGEFNSYDSFEDFFEAFKKQVVYQVNALAEVQKIVYEETAKDAPFLYLSMLYDDCLGIGKPIFDGGIRYLGGTLETYGNISCSDSLHAIKKLVYDEQKISKEVLLVSLASNFEGYSDIKKKLVNVPKYGNDDDAADQMAVRVNDFVCNTVRDAREQNGLHNYLAVVINNNNNVLQGRACIASADGRMDGGPMSNGNAPTSGNDRSGVTAFLNSITKPDCNIHAGSVQNMKFSKQLARDNHDTFKLLLNTYFNNGGSQAMLNVLGKEDLENAMKHPEQYKNLVVRVGGFSEYFVKLDKDDQLDIIQRTIY